MLLSLRRSTVGAWGSKARSARRSVRAGGQGSGPASPQPCVALVAADIVTDPIRSARPLCFDNAVLQKRDILRNGFKSGKLRSLEYRKYQILQLIYMIKENSERFDQALIDDTGRPVNETRLCVSEPEKFR